MNLQSIKTKKIKHCKKQTGRSFEKQDEYTTFYLVSFCCNDFRCDSKTCTIWLSPGIYELMYFVYVCCCYFVFFYFLKIVIFKKMFKRYLCFSYVHVTNFSTNSRIVQQ